MSAIALADELCGLQDAVVALVEALNAARMSRHQSRGRRKLRRVLWRMWRVQQGRVIEHWFPYLKASHLFVESSTDGLIRLLGGLLSQDESMWVDELADVLVEIVNVAAKDALSGLRVATGFDIPTARIEAEIRRNAAKLVSGLNETTRNELRGILEQAVADRLSYSQTAKLLRVRFQEFGALVPLHHVRDRAELIAVTEVGQAYTRGQQATGDALVAAGIPIEKAWLTAEDDRVEAECETNGAAGWIDWEDPFPSGHDAPLAHPGCRCALQMQPKEF
jgi:hypothetical protein